MKFFRVFFMELMSLICEYQLDKNKTAAKKLFDKIISDRFNILLGKNFKIPEFFDFDPLYYEAKGWTEYLKVPSKDGMNKSITSPFPPMSVIIPKY